MDIRISLSVPPVNMPGENVFPGQDLVPLDFTLQAHIDVPVNQIPLQRYDELSKRWHYFQMHGDSHRISTSVSGDSVIQIMARITEEVIKIVGGNTPAERFISKA